MKRDFLTYPNDWLRTPRTLQDNARDASAVERFHKAQNKAIEIAAGLCMTIGFIAAVGLYFWS